MAGVDAFSLYSSVEETQLVAGFSLFSSLFLADWFILSFLFQTPEGLSRLASLLPSFLVGHSFSLRAVV